jgi:hypothetical protein
VKKESDRLLSDRFIHTMDHQGLLPR